MTFRHSVAVACLALTTMTIVSCKPKEGAEASGSGVKAVAIAETKVKSQGSIGFCWAYATTALIESLYKERTGKSIALSPEALGFWGMVRNIKRHLDTFRGASYDEFQAGFPHKFAGYFVINPTGNGQDAMTMLKRLGVVDQQSYPIKFTDRTQVEQGEAAIRGSIIDLLRQRGGDSSGISEDDIATIVTRAMQFPRPPTVLRDGTTTVDFMRKTLAFNPEDYVLWTPQGDWDYAAIISGLKQLLARHISVPLSFTISRPYAFQGRRMGVPPSVEAFDAGISGGHAVLVTDFVNRGTHEGALPEAALLAEVAKSADELDYILFKNSWGESAKTNEGGLAVSGSPDGYYEMPLGYIKANIASENVGERFGIIVPAQLRGSISAVNRADKESARGGASRIGRAPIDPIPNPSPLPPRPSASVTLGYADIRPVFMAKCTGCHTGGSASGGFSVETGPNGQTTAEVIRSRVILGSPSFMPPENSGMKLAPDEMAKVNAWLSQGGRN